MPECKKHPDAPHGFLRNESHSQGRYVCECEFWEPESLKGFILPRLPKRVVIDRHIPTGIAVYGYTAEQMREYAKKVLKEYINETL